MPEGAKEPVSKMLTAPASTRRAPTTAMMVPTTEISTEGALVMPNRAATG